MAMGSTQTLTEMSARNVLWEVKPAGADVWQFNHVHAPIFLKSGNLNLLESSGSVQNCTGIALPSPFETAHSTYLRRRLGRPHKWPGRNEKFPCHLAVRDVVAVLKRITLAPLTLILRRSRTGTVWFYTSTSNKRAARPKLYTKSLTRDLKLMYSRLTLVRISINL